MREPKQTHLLYRDCLEVAGIGSQPVRQPQHPLGMSSMPMELVLAALDTRAGDNGI